MKSLVNNNIYTILYILLAFVHISGTFIPLLENDSAQHAVMAMRMYLENDFFNLYRGVDVYLDKPHLHFWLAALSYKIFGLNQFAYRIPALLFTLLGAYACFKLFADLYKNKKLAHWASIMFLCTQAIILANHDVRTDAVLTGSVILSIWQLYRFIKTQKIWPLVTGCFFMGLAFSSKGLLGLVVIALSLLCHIAYTKNWKALLTPKLFIGLIVFGLSIAPVLYAYYLQFDLHPEVSVDGVDHISGIRFILWDQSFNRMTAKGFDHSSNDHFFFLHTILWAFFPWAIIFYTGLFSRFISGFKTKFRYQYNHEWLTLGGIILMLIIISTSKSKLPHYLNSLLPSMSVFTAGYLYVLSIQKKNKALKYLTYTNYLILFVAVLASVCVLFLTFGFPQWYLLVANILIIGLLISVLRNKEDIGKQIVCIAALCAIMVNINMNGYFYPHLLKYQSGKYMAEYIHNNLNDEKVYIIDKEYRWSLDFYSHQNINNIDSTALPQIKTPVLIATGHLTKIEELLQNTGLKIEIVKEFEDYRVTRLSLKFLNPKTRADQVGRSYLLRVVP